MSDDIRMNVSDTPLLGATVNGMEEILAEIKDMEYSISCQCFQFEEEMVAQAMRLPNSKRNMSLVCKKIHEMRWILTTGLTKAEFISSIYDKHGYDEKGCDMISDMITDMITEEDPIDEIICPKYSIDNCS